MRLFSIPLVLVSGLSLTCFGVHAADIHVPGDFPTIQAGIDAASTGDNIIVADGTYTGLGNRDIDLRGLDITVISANGATNCTIDCQSNGRAFMLASGEVITTRISGFTILNGSEEGGGGILIETNSSGTIEHCVFESNVSSLFGGAIMVEGNGHAIITDCSFISNSAVQDGGAVEVQHSGTQVEIFDSLFTTNTANRGGAVAILNGNLQISDSTFTGNEAARMGGALYLSATSSVTGCNFDANIGGFDGGGGIFSNAWPLMIDACSFTNNLTEQGAGGGINLLMEDPVISNTYLAGNSARVGGGISCLTGYIVNCVFDSNAATDQFFQIGGGGLNCEDAVVANSLFINNSAIQVGGGVAARGPAQLINCTLSRNTAGFAGGGMVHIGGINGEATLGNSILWDNSATDGPQLALIEGFLGDPAEVLVTYSNLQGGETDIFEGGSSTLTWGPGNINANPMFNDPKMGDFHANAGSPVIDAANNLLVPADIADIDNDKDVVENLPLDLDLIDRFIDDPNTTDTGNGDAPIVDMGAYEFPPETGITVVCPDTATINRGIETGGSIGNLCSSDDADWSFQPDALAATVVAPINIELVGITAVSDGSEFSFNFEVAASHSGVVLRIEIFNFTSKSWESSIFPNIATSDTIYTVSRNANVSDYIGGSGELSARVTFIRPAGVPPFWNIGMDQSVWKIVE